MITQGAQRVGDPAADDAAPRLLTRAALCFVLSGLFALGSLRASTLEAGIAFIVGVLACVALYVGIRPFGFASIGGVTLVAVAGLFLMKWLVFGGVGAPPTALVVSPEPALRVVAVGAAAFAAGYLLALRRGLSGIQLPPRESEPVATGPWAPFFVLALVLTAGRLYVARRWNIGVPNRAPSAVPLLGVVHYVTSFGPLVCAAGLWLLGQRRDDPARKAAAVAFLIHTAVGVSIGWRGDVARTALAWAVAHRLGADDRIRRHPLRTTLVLVAAATLCLGALSLAMSSRRGTAATPGDLGGAVEFLVQRLGGIDFLSPIVAHVNQYGSSAGYLAGPEWDHFLKVDVYGLPPSAQTGFAGTAFGWWYGVGGLAATAAAGFAFGGAGAIADKYSARKRAQGANLSVRLATVVVILIWANFLLEGTFDVAMKSGVIATAIALSIAAGSRFLRPANRLAPPVSPLPPATAGR